MNETVVRAAESQIAAERPRTRHVAVHLHIFKNAGTSLDKILSLCFGEAHHSFDKKSPGAVLSIAEVAEIIAARPEMRCFTSHQVRLPLPVADHIILHPIFFLRDPIERVQSCFHFERDVQKIYPETLTMEDYVRRSLGNPRINAVIGLQTSILCDNRLLSPDRLKTDLTREAIASAAAALHAVPAFGLVEHFRESMACIGKSLRRHLPELAKAAKQGDVRENTSAGSLERPGEKRRYVRENLKAGTYTRLVDQTAPDRHLYEEGRKLFLSRYGRILLDSSPFSA